MTQNNQDPMVMRPLAAAFSHHGKPLRGLMSTPQSHSFQGRFGRMFRRPHPTPSYGKTDADSRAALKTLGKLMTSDLDLPKDGLDGEESGIPALYTYFGQFIDHDITFDPMTTLMSNFDPDALTDFRTPALDLDNVYGRGPSDQPYLYDNNNKFLLGAEIGNGAFDLPRNSATPARALIGDPRNDENSIVSQFQGLMLRFHNRVVDSHLELDFFELQRIVRWHYQWVIVNDFLSQIISAKVLENLKTNGKFDQNKLKFYHYKKSPFIPVEFSAAAYRLGHSMIRPSYRLNNDVMLPIFPISAELAATIEGAPEEGFPVGLTGFQTLPPDRRIDWKRFIDIGKPRANGEAPKDDDDDPPSDEQKNRLQFAYRIDTSVVTPLAYLPTSVAPDPPPSLAERNLLRGYELGLPTGQTVARAMGLTPLYDNEIIIGKAVDEVKSGDVRGKLSDLPQLAPFRGKCPLWTYILAEAMVNHVQINIPVSPPVKSVKTPQLGPVGGRIVAEVFLGMLFADKSSYLCSHPDWKPTIKNANGEVGDFKLKDIVAYALGEDAPK
jgi:hypothetical protein